MYVSDCISYLFSDYQIHDKLAVIQEKRISRSAILTVLLSSVFSTINLLG